MALVNFNLYFVLFISIVFFFFVDSVPKKKETLIEEKFIQLTEWSQRRPIIQMNGEKFRTYVKAVPKNYSVIVQLTALQAKRQCAICRQVNDELQVAANSWRYEHNSLNKLFFVSVDFDEGPDIFSMLEINTVPLIMHWPAKGKPKKADTMDLNRMGFSAEVLARFIAERTEISIRIFRPPNYFGTISVAIVLSMVGGVIYVKRNNLQFIYNKTSWGIVSMVIILAMTSGQMWNHIRGAQFLFTNSQNGMTHYVHGSSQAQFIVESYIIMFINGAVVAGLMLLSEANCAKKDSTKRKVMSLVGLVLILFFFSLLLSVFRAKQRGYPYSLFIK